MAAEEGKTYQEGLICDKDLAYLLYTYEFFTIDQICEYMRVRGKPHAKATISKYISEEHTNRKNRGVIFEGSESAMVNQAQHIAFAHVWTALNDVEDQNHAWAVRYVATNPDKLLSMSQAHKKGTKRRGTRKPNDPPKFFNTAALFTDSGAEKDGG